MLILLTTLGIAGSWIALMILGEEEAADFAESLDTIAEARSPDPTSGPALPRGMYVRATTSLGHLAAVERAETSTVTI